ncbi:RNA pseudouridine synthase, partial [Mesorhizobium sp. M00.F.Ca.ET.149.01.1.1]
FAERPVATFRKGPPREGKPFEKREGRKPYSSRGDRPSAAEGERGDFKRSHKPREMGEGAERGDRPFRKGPPREGKPFEKREGRKPYSPPGDRP